MMNEQETGNVLPCQKHFTGPIYSAVESCFMKVLLIRDSVKCSFFHHISSFLSFILLISQIKVPSCIFFVARDIFCTFSLYLLPGKLHEVLL